MNPTTPPSPSPPPPLTLTPAERAEVESWPSPIRSHFEILAMRLEFMERHPLAEAEREAFDECRMIARGGNP